MDLGKSDGSMRRTGNGGVLVRERMDRNKYEMLGMVDGSDVYMVNFIVRHMLSHHSELLLFSIQFI
jgi:hypothetical protein